MNVCHCVTNRCAEIKQEREGVREKEREREIDRESERERERARERERDCRALYAVSRVYCCMSLLRLQFALMYISLSTSLILIYSPSIN